MYAYRLTPAPRADLPTALKREKKRGKSLHVHGKGRWKVLGL